MSRLAATPVTGALIRLAISLFANGAAFLLAFGPTKRGVYMLGSQKPIPVDDANVRSVLARPGVAQDLIDTPDNPAPSADAWAQNLDHVTWLGDDGARAFAAGAPHSRRPAGHGVLPPPADLRPTVTVDERNLRAATPPG